MLTQGNYVLNSSLYATCAQTRLIILFTSLLQHVSSSCYSLDRKWGCGSEESLHFGMHTYVTFKCAYSVEPWDCFFSCSYGNPKCGQYYVLPLYWIGSKKRNFETLLFGGKEQKLWVSLTFISWIWLSREYYIHYSGALDLSYSIRQHRSQMYT